MHIGLRDQRTAIELLLTPPEIRPLAKADRRAGGFDLKKPNGHANGNRQFDTLWAQLPEHVKAKLLAMVKVGHYANPATISESPCSARRC